MPRKNRSQVLDDIRRTVRLEAVLRDFDREVVNKSGRPVALCPFHDDNKPSLNIYDTPASGYPHFHCYSCNTHGDVFALTKELKSCSFREAVIYLAEKFLPSDLRDRALQAGRQLPTNSRAKGLALAFNRYESVGRQPASVEKVRAWAKEERNIDPESIIRADVFYNPGGTLLKKKTWSIDEVDALFEAGVLRRKDYVEAGTQATGHLNLGDTAYDFFRGEQVIFTLREAGGGIAGFAGRQVGPNVNGSRAKYLYSPGFRRSDTLYRLDAVEARLRDSESTKEPSSEYVHLYIAEGLMDALRLESLGMNAVAVLGSSFAKGGAGKGQLDLLRNLAEKLSRKSIILVCHIFLDADAAGRAGTSRVLSDLLTLRKICPDLRFDVIAPNVVEGSNSKDPDDLLKNCRSDLDAKKLCIQWSCSPVEFFLADELSCEIRELEESWRALSPLRQSSALSRLRKWISGSAQALEPGQAWLEDAPPKHREHREWWQAVRSILTPASESQSAIVKLSGVDKEHFSEQISRAIRMARQSRQLRDFPQDLLAWQRIQAGQRVLRHYFSENMAAPPAPLLPTYVPRDSGDEPRLKVVPCPEDLVRQQYVLAALLKNIPDLPAVRAGRSSNFASKRVRTTGLDGKSDSQTVSFAYQVDEDALERGDGALFVHYSECWKHFNEYVLRGLNRFGGATVHAARLDVRRYYDRIPLYAVRNVLMPSLRMATSASRANSLVWALDSSEDAPEVRAEKLCTWLCEQSFGYKYYHHELGVDELLVSPPNRGIPQGPDLSAWLGTITLFPLDATMIEYCSTLNSKLRNDLEDSTDKEDGEAPVFARYARYVDDIVLIAPNAYELNQMHTVIENKLRELGLELGQKTKPVEPMEKREFIDWFMRDRGLVNSPSEGNFGIAELENFEGQDPVFLGRQDRRFALNALHDNALDRSGDSERTIRHYLQLVMASGGELRYRDLVYVAKRTWQMVFSATEAANGNVKSVVRGFRNEWKKFRDRVPQGNATASETAPKSIKMDLAALIGAAQPVLIAMEAIKDVLVRRPDRNPLFGEDDREYHGVMRDYVARTVLDGLVEALYEEMDDDVRQSISFLLIQRELELKILAQEVAKNGKSRTDSVAVRKNLEERYKKPTRSQGVESFLISIGLSGQEQVQKNTLTVFHGMLQTMSEYSPHTSDGEDILEPWRATLTGTEDFAQALRMLLGDSTFRATSEGESGSGTALALDALIVLAQVAPLESQMDLLRRRHHLVGPLLSESESKVASNMAIYVLPFPDQLPHFPGLVAVRVDIKSQVVEDYYTITGTAAESADVLTKPFANFSPQEIQNGENSAVKVCRIGAEPLIFAYNLFENSALTNVNKIRITPYLFEALSKRVDTAEGAYTLLTAPSTLLSKDFDIDTFADSSCFVFSWELSEPLAETTTLVGISRGRGKTISVPAESAKYWRIGIALADLLRVPISIGMSPWDKVGAERWDLRKDDRVSQHFLHACYHVLSGGKWWSRPRRGSGTERPDVVSRVLERMTRYAELKGDSAERKRLALLLTGTFEARAIYLAVRDEAYRNTGGWPLHALDSLSSHLVDSNASLIDSVVGDNHPGTLLADSIPRVVSAWLGIANTLERALGSEKEEVEGQAMVASARIRAIGLYARTIVLETLNSDIERLDRIREDGLVDLEVQAEISNVNDWLLVISAHSETKGFGGLVSALESSFRDDPYSCGRHLSRITPLGWLVALGILTRRADILRELSDLALPDEENAESGELPWGLLQSVAVKCSESEWSNKWIGRFQKFDERESCRTSTQTSPYFSVRLEQGGEFRIDGASDGASHLLHPSAVHAEFLGSEKKAEENVRPDGKVEKYWSERWQGERLVSVSYVGHLLAKLSGPKLPGDFEQESEIREIAETAERDRHLETESVIRRDDVSEPDVTGNSIISHRSSERKKSDGGASDNETLTEFKTRQSEIWRERGTLKAHNTVRVGLLQFRTNDTYDGPEVKDCHKNLEKDCSNSLKMDNPLEFKSKAEARRRNVIEAAINACKAFKVDALLLPEYSVRPETVEWIQSKIEGALMVWAGTYKLPASWPESRRPFGDENNIPHGSILNLVTKHSHAARKKKYPSIAGRELFLPGEGPLRPLARNLKEKRTGRKFEARDFFFELICSEAFVFSSPFNFYGVANAYDSLRRQFGVKVKGSSIDEVMNDLKGIGLYTSFSLPDSDSDPCFPRRSILMVPAMSTRVSDFLVLGQANLLAAGICTVFCNLVWENSGGQSGFIGHDSWKKSDKKPTLGHYDSPYHDLYPGIFNSHKDSDLLGRNEEALVIADIDPVHTLEGHPRPPALPVPQRLVAHLPVVEWRAEPGKENPTKHRCSEMPTLKRISSLLEKLLAHCGSIDSDSSMGDNNPKNLASLLFELWDLEGRRSDWLYKRAERYETHHKTYPVACPPPSALDFLLVKKVDLENEWPSLCVPKPDSKVGQEDGI